MEGFPAGEDSPMEQLQIHGLSFLESGRVRNQVSPFSGQIFCWFFLNKKWGLLTDVDRNQTLGSDFC